jgi:hypothetical protein
MQYTIASALLVASASASVIGGGWGAPAAPAAPPALNETAPVWSTEVVTALTTYCPLATVLTHAGVTYTVTSATTLTITDCPCTITHSSSAWVTPTSTPVAPVVPSVKVSSTPVAPVWTTSTPAPYTYSNATVPVTSWKPSASVPVTTGPAQVTANAGSNLAAPGAALAGVLGAVAYLL